MTDSVLKPGEVIRPELDEQMVRTLVRDLYGLTVSRVKELNSYDDRNFWIHASHSNNPCIKQPSEHGYVLKILNLLDSKFTDAMDTQNEMILHVHSQGVPTPRPMRNLDNKLMSVEQISNPSTNATGDYIVRLFEYIPGRILHGAPYTAKLMYQTGRLAGRIDTICKDWRPVAFEAHKRIWSLTEVPKLTQFLDCITDQSKRSLAEAVIQAFNNNVVAKYGQLQKGVIHGDFNEQNILISKADDKLETELTAILDFGDSTTSYYVFEIGILLMYMMIGSNSKDAFETAGHALAGYLSEFTLPPLDLGLLKECIAGRFAQSLVMGSYSASMDPENSEHLLITTPKGWPLLERLWNAPKHELYGQFGVILRSYGIHADFGDVDNN